MLYSNIYCWHEPEIIVSLVTGSFKYLTTNVINIIQRYAIKILYSINISQIKYVFYVLALVLNSATYKVSFYRHIGILVFDVNTTQFD